MEPLSISVSCITVLGALATSGKGIGKLIALRDAPEELHELSNEVESLRLLTSQVQQCFLSLHGQAHQDHRDAILGQLNSMCSSVDDLETFIEYRLKRVGKDGASSTLSKREWLRAGPKIEKHRRRISSARHNLSALMTAIGVQLSGQQYALQLQSISYRDIRQANGGAASSAVGTDENGLVMQAERAFSRLETLVSKLEVASSGSSPGTDASDQSCRPLEAPNITSKRRHGPECAKSSGSNAFVPSQSQKTTPRRLLQRQEGHLSINHDAVDEPQSIPSTASKLASTTQRGNPASFVCVSATMNVRSCPPFCRCQCHVATHIQTPCLLKGVLGQLFCTYTGLLRTTSCNYPPCRKRPNKTRFLFYFPTWLAARALTISGYGRALTSPEASWALKIPVVVPSDHPVWWATRTGNIPFLKAAFLNDIQPWIIDEDGDSLLHRAVDSHQVETLQFLLPQNTTLDIENQWGETPLTISMQKSSRTRREAMNAFGLTMEDVMDECAFTKLHASTALLQGYDLVSTELLETTFADVNQPDKTGMTPLHWACMRGDASAIQLLLRWKADPRLWDRRGWTCLHYAAWSDDIDSVRLLLESGFMVDVLNTWGRTAIYYVNDPTLLELLVSYGANVNHTDHLDKYTSLHMAVARGFSKEVVEMFVHLGADICAVTTGGTDAITLAIFHDRFELLRTLLQSVKQAKVWLPCSQHELRSANQMTRCTPCHLFPRLDVAHADAKLQGSPVWIRDGDGHHALHWAALSSGIEVMQVLADENLEGLDPTAPDNLGATPTVCFYCRRDAYCAIIRDPFEEEEEAWWSLMKSACRQKGIDFDTFEPRYRKKYEAKKARVMEVGTDDEGDTDDDDDDDDDDDEFTDAVEDQTG